MKLIIPSITSAFAFSTGGVDWRRTFGWRRRCSRVAEIHDPGDAAVAEELEKLRSCVTCGETDARWGCKLCRGVRYCEQAVPAAGLEPRRTAAQGDVLARRARVSSRAFRGPPRILVPKRRREESQPEPRTMRDDCDERASERTNEQTNAFVRLEFQNPTPKRFLISLPSPARVRVHPWCEKNSKSG